MVAPVASNYDLTTQVGQLAWAEAEYRDGATGLPVQADQDAREALVSAPHTAKTNAQLGTGLNHKTVNFPAVHADVYTGGNIVTVAANRAGVDMMPEDTQNTEDLEQEVLVGAAVQNGTLFSKGGFLGSQYAGVAGAYMDPAFLVEASKQTGEKFF
jgi:hypothetical protein